MIPVSHARQDDPLEVVQNLVKALTLGRRRVGERFTHLTRVHLRERRIAIGMAQVVADPLDEAMPVAAKGIGVHVTKLAPGHARDSGLRIRDGSASPAS